MSTFPAGDDELDETLPYSPRVMEQLRRENPRVETSYPNISDADSNQTVTDNALDETIPYSPSVMDRLRREDPQVQVHYPDPARRRQKPKRDLDFIYE